MGRLLKVATRKGRLRHIKQENVGGAHRGPIHVLHAGEEVYSSVHQFGALLQVCPVPISVNGRVIVVLDWVLIIAKVTYPLLTLLNELHERIDVGTAVLAPDDWLVAEACRWNFLARWQLSVGLDRDCKWDTAIFRELVVGRDSVSGKTQERFVTIVIIHGFSLKRCC
jgi:hypothetical protein